MGVKTCVCVCVYVSMNVWVIHMKPCSARLHTRRTTQPVGHSVCLTSNQSVIEIPCCSPVADKRTGQSATGPALSLVFPPFCPHFFPPFFLAEESWAVPESISMYVSVKLSGLFTLVWFLGGHCCSPCSTSSEHALVRSSVDQL